MSNIQKYYHPRPRWIVYNPNDSVRCDCGSEEDAQLICRINPDCRYSLLKALGDQYVDVSHTGERVKELTPQKILEPQVPELPMSHQSPLNIK